ncbi:hypothetical protein DSECCO2_296440 [anaerobic digester metagenome]
MHAMHARSLTDLLDAGVEILVVITVDYLAVERLSRQSQLGNYRLHGIQCRIFGFAGITQHKVLVLGIRAGIQDGDELALAFVAQIPG